MAASNAVRIHKTGGPEELRFEVVDVGQPGSDEVLVRHKAIGVNFTDLHHRTGRYPGPGFPLTLGMEAAGVVEEVGCNVGEFRPGDRIAYGGASPSLSPGAYCQLRIMNPARLVKIPDWLDYETAAAIFLKGLTAQYLLKGAYHLQKRETTLIHAAAGGVGTLLCQWARHLGVTVIGAVSSAEKAETALHNGCHHVIVLTRDDAVGCAREFTGGKGVDVVYDSVGANTFEISLASLRKRGVLVSFGSASGPVPPFDIFRLNRMGSLSLVGAGLADYIGDRKEMLERAQDLFDALHAGVLHVGIRERYPLSEAARAHRDIEGRRTTGISILLP